MNHLFKAPEHEGNENAVDHIEQNSMMATSNVVELAAPGDPFVLESGQSLAAAKIAYEQYGALNAAGDNAILVCHALTGSAHAADLPAEPLPGSLKRARSTSPFTPLAAEQSGWWDPLIGPGKVLDTTKYSVICSNILGSCYGTSGPAESNPETGKPYAIDFPAITIRDMVHLQKRLLDALGVTRLQYVIGGSLGGMQVLEWALCFPDFVETIVPIATAAQHSPWAIGLNESARMAIMNDPAWKNGRYTQQPRDGLALARAIAMVTYRSPLSFQQRQGRETLNGNGNGSSPGPFDNTPRYQIESYLQYQGKKLVKRFDANSYIAITRAMDSHDVARGRGSLDETLGSIKAKTLCIGINSDVLYPAGEQRQIAAAIPKASYAEIDSIHGHDAFLIEFDQLEKIVKV